MRTPTLRPDENRYGTRFRGFEALMRNRVQDILLVSNLYDSFILSEDGRLHESLLDRFLDLNLYNAPGITRVSSGHEAIDRTFLWQGDVRILLTIVKHIEDKLNVEQDTLESGVPVVLVVEDNVRYYSAFLPEIYEELMTHSQRLISEGVNLAHKILRMRARPKVLLASSFEEAWDLFEAYGEHALGIISDVEFLRAGEPVEWQIERSGWCWRTGSASCSRPWRGPWPPSRALRSWRSARAAGRWPTGSRRRGPTSSSSTWCCPSSAGWTRPSGCRSTTRGWRWWS